MERLIISRRITTFIRLVSDFWTGSGKKTACLFNPREMYVCTYVLARVCLYICMHVCMYICMYVVRLAQEKKNAMLYIVVRNVNLDLTKINKLSYLSPQRRQKPKTHKLKGISHLQSKALGY